MQGLVMMVMVVEMMQLVQLTAAECIERVYGFLFALLRGFALLHGFALLRRWVTHLCSRSPQAALILCRLLLLLLLWLVLLLLLLAEPLCLAKLLQWARFLGLLYRHCLVLRLW